MLKQTLSTLGLSAMLFAGWSAAALAQNLDWPRAHRVIEKADTDLHHIEHHEAWATGDRGHYEAAEHNLADVRKDLDHNRLDRARLDAVVSEIEYITHVDRIDPHARERLNEDARELHRLRDEWHWR
jgi:hypothetical protein